MKHLPFGGQRLKRDNLTSVQGVVGGEVVVDFPQHRSLGQDLEFLGSLKMYLQNLHQQLCFDRVTNPHGQSYKSIVVMKIGKNAEQVMAS